MKYRIWAHWCKGFDPDYFVSQGGTFCEYDIWDEIEPSEFVVQRASGVLDWTGKEIYEGDLIKADGYGPYPVEFEKGCFGSCIYSDFEPLFKYNTIEVVGNILENPNWNEV